MTDETAAARTDTRRAFLYGVTAAMGAAGIAAAAWPFVSQMNPDAAARMAGDFVEVDAATLADAELRVVKWRQMPVFVMRRTSMMLAAMREPTLVGKLADPQSVKRQQPDYARNWHRSADPATAVLVGICTYCACVPRFFAEDAATADALICPCCAAHYDAAGRAAHGPAQYNLPVPPYVMDGSRIVIGKNPPGEMFSITSVERV